MKRNVGLFTFVVLLMAFAGLSFAGEFSGDIRIRYENVWAKDTESRQRERFRFRFAFERQVNDKLNVGLRLVSGSNGCQNSANQTFEDSFSSKPIWIDWAYLQLTPAPTFSLTAGKMRNPFYNTELVWDGNISPEGIIFQANPESFEDSKLFLRLGLFPLDEYKEIAEDPLLLGAQGDISYQKLRLGLAYYDYRNIKGKAIEDISPYYVCKTNTLQRDEGSGKNSFAYSYRILDANMEFGLLDISLPPVKNPLPLKLCGNFAINVAEDVDENKAWLAGVSLGSAKKAGDIQVSYSYRKTDRDALPSITNDSSFHNGGTNNKGHKAELRYVFINSATLGVIYYNTQDLDSSKKQNKLQIDLIAKF